MAEKYNSYEICYHCDYATDNKQSMVNHLLTDKHTRNINKPFKVFDDPEAIMQKNFKRRMKVHIERKKKNTWNNLINQYDNPN